MLMIDKISLDGVCLKEEANQTQHTQITRPCCWQNQKNFSERYNAPQIFSLSLHGLHVLIINLNQFQNDKYSP